MGVPFHLMVIGAAQQGLEAVTVVDAVDGEAQAVELFVLVEEEFELTGGVELHGIESDAADAVPFGEEAGDQGLGHLEAGGQHVVVEVGESGRGEAEGDALPGHVLEADVAGVQAGAASIAPHAVAEHAHGGGDLTVDAGGIGGPVGERMHIADLLGDVFLLFGEDHGAVLAGHRFEEHLPEVAAEQALEHTGSAAHGVVDGMHVLGFELGEAPRSYPPHLFEAQGEDRFAGGLLVEHHGHAIGLVQVAGQLGVGLRVGNTHRAHQTRAPVHGVAQAVAEVGDLLGLAPLQEGDVHEELVHAVRLDVGREILQHVDQLLRHRLVLLVVYPQHHHEGTQLLGLEGRHRGLDAQLARLVAAGGADAPGDAVLLAPSADDERDAVQVVAHLLDLGIKAVQVEVQVQTWTRAQVLLGRGHRVVERDAVHISGEIVGHGGSYTYIAHISITNRHERA